MRSAARFGTPSLRRHRLCKWTSAPAPKVLYAVCKATLRPRRESEKQTVWFRMAMEGREGAVALENWQAQPGNPPLWGRILDCPSRALNDQGGGLFSTGVFSDMSSRPT